MLCNNPFSPRDSCGKGDGAETGAAERGTWIKTGVCNGIRQQICLINKHGKTQKAKGEEEEGRTNREREREMVRENGRVA